MPAKLLKLVKAVFLLIIFVFTAGCMDSVGDSIQPTQTVKSSLPSADRAEIQLLSPGDNSLYYYVEGVRTPLILSLKWIAVKFASANPAEQSDALQGSSAGPLKEARQIRVPALTLLPLREGLTTAMLMQQIDTLRADRSSFLQVNPVFQTEDAELIITDQFIATFSSEKEKEEIDAINSLHGVEIVEPIPGQVNTFVLRVTEMADLDSLSIANLYQESGIAIYAAPNFIRIIQK